MGMDLEVTRGSLAAARNLPPGTQQSCVETADVAAWKYGFAAGHAYTNLRATEGHSLASTTTDPAKTHAQCHQENRSDRAGSAAELMAGKDDSSIIAGRLIGFRPGGMLAPFSSPGRNGLMIG